MLATLRLAKKNTNDGCKQEEACVNVLIEQIDMENCWQPSILHLLSLSCEAFSATVLHAKSI